MEHVTRAGNKTRIPLALRGDRKQVSIALRRIVRAAWVDCDWDRANDREESTELLEIRDEPIIIQQMPWELPPTVSAWRLHDLDSALFKVVDAATKGGRWKASGQDALDHYSRVVILGMDYLWFTLAMLNVQGPHAWPIVGLRSMHVMAFHEFRNYVRWLPEILALEKELYFGDLARAAARTIGIPAWATRVIGNAAMVCELTNHLPEICDRFGGDVVAYMLNKDVIESNEGRFIVGSRVEKAVEDEIDSFSLDVQ